MPSITHGDSASLACLGHLERQRGLGQAGMAESEIVTFLLKSFANVNKPLAKMSSITPSDSAIPACLRPLCR